MEKQEIIKRFKELEALDEVKLKTEYEIDNYFDVYKESGKTRENTQHLIEEYGCVCCISQYKDIHGGWTQADSVGWIVLPHPLDPEENCYIIDLMKAAIQEREKVIDEIKKRADAALILHVFKNLHPASDNYGKITDEVRNALDIAVKELSQYFTPIVDD